MNIRNMVNGSHLKYNHWKTSLKYTLDKPLRVLREGLKPSRSATNDGHH